MVNVSGGTVAPGTTLNGIYVIDERIAQGGMGEVFAGRTIQTGDKVAIKMILPEHAEDELIVGLFRKEASTLHNLYHKAIVRYFLFSVDPVLHRPYLVMEFAAGPSLGTHVKEHGPLSDRDLATLRRRIAGGLFAAHRVGVFHRDISPDNIILVDGKVSKAKIIDFGIAKSADSNETLIGSSLAGKMNYISPEQLGLNGGKVSAKSDIYSFGLVLAEAATGKALPMTGSQVDIIEKRRDVPNLSDVPGDIRPLIQWMLAPRPEDRPDDMSAVVEWGEDSTAPRRPAGPGRSKSVRTVLAASAVAASVALAGVFVLGQMGGEEASFNMASGAANPVRPILEPVQEDVVAPRAEVGQSYEWSSTPFAYSGESAKLLIRSIGRVPPGLIFSRDPQGVSTVAGVPTESGSFSFLIDAESPEGLVAEQIVILTVGEPG